MGWLRKGFELWSMEAYSLAKSHSSDAEKELFKKEDPKEASDTNNSSEGESKEKEATMVQGEGGGEEKIEDVGIGLCCRDLM